MSGAPIGSQIKGSTWIVVGLGVGITVTAWLFVDRTSSDDPSVPLVEAAPEYVATDGPVVRVTADGRVLVDGAQKTVNQLLESFGGIDRGRAVEVRGDGDALWMHVQWVLAALNESGFAAAQCVVRVRGNPKEGTVTVPLHLGTWEERLWTPSDPVELGGVMEIAVRIRKSEHGSPSFILGLEQEIVTEDASVVAKWARESFAGLGKHQSGVGWVEASGAVQYQAVAIALAALEAAGSELIVVGLEALHPWDRDSQVLPPPPHEDPIFRWFVTDLSIPNLMPVNLPVASASVEDKDDDPEDRVIVTITADGRIVFRDEELTLAGLADCLVDQDRLYCEKLRRFNRPTYEESPDGRRWSRLYVLLRVDQNAPLQWVQWVVGEACAKRIYKLQLGTRKFPSPDLTDDEIARRWAGRHVIFPPGTFQSKLQCFQFLPAERPSAGTLTVQILDDSDMLAFRGRRTSSADELVQWLSAAAAPRNDEPIAGRVSAEPRTPWRHAVTVVNCFALARFDFIWLDGVERAPPNLRHTSPLPGHQPK